MKTKTVCIEDAFKNLPFFGYHYKDLFYKGKYRDEIAKLGIYVPDLALNRLKPHQSINALVCVVNKYASTYFLIRNNTGGAITNVTINFTYNTTTIIGAYGEQYSDNISIARMENGEDVLVPYQFKAGATAGRIIGKAIKVTYTDANGVSQTAYTTNPIFIICSSQPKIRAYETHLDYFYYNKALDIRRFIPFLEVAPFNSNMDGIYISRFNGSDPSISVTAINSWLSGATTRWANIMYRDDANGWYGYTIWTGQNLINKLDPATELGAKPMTLDETVTTGTLGASGTNAAPSTNYDLALQLSPQTTYYAIVIKKASPWLSLWYGYAIADDNFPNRYFKDYAFFAYLITVPLRRLGFFSTEYTA